MECFWDDTYKKLENGLFLVSSGKENHLRLKWGYSPGNNNPIRALTNEFLGSPG